MNTEQILQDSVQEELERIAAQIWSWQLAEGRAADNKNWSQAVMCNRMWRRLSEERDHVYRRSVGLCA